MLYYDMQLMNNLGRVLFMKKKLALLLALVMVCATMLTACGSSSKLSNTTWYLTKLNVGDVEITAEQIEEAYGESKIFFKKNGVCEVLLDGEESEGDWKLDGDKVIIMSDEESIEGILSDSEFVLELYGTKMTFTKK